MYSSRKYPSPPHGRVFCLGPPPPSLKHPSKIFQLSFVHFLYIFDLTDPPHPAHRKFQSPLFNLMGGMRLFSVTAEWYMYMLFA